MIAVAGTSDPQPPFLRLSRGLLGSALVDLSKNKTALAVCVVATGIVATAALAAIAWPALVRPDPPSEASGDGGLRIHVVQPPQASVKPM